VQRYTIGEKCKGNSMLDELIRFIEINKAKKHEWPGAKCSY
jgi:hypothetical protein